MPREHMVGIITGLILVASVILMIDSLDRVSRNLRGPQAHPRVMFYATEFR